MVKEVTMYSIVCDACSTTFIDEDSGHSDTGDPDLISDMTIDSGWLIEKEPEEQRHHCPSCCS